MDRAIQIRTALAAGPVPAGALCKRLSVSRPTLARALAPMFAEIVTLGAARSTQYALRDILRGLADIAVYRVNAAGQIEPLGHLTPVRPEGFVMRDCAGQTTYYEGLPWWLSDMRPQGFWGAPMRGNMRCLWDCHPMCAIGVTPTHCGLYWSTAVTQWETCCLGISPVIDS